jgi:hypothetical protein
MPLYGAAVAAIARQLPFRAAVFISCILYAATALSQPDTAAPKNTSNLTVVCLHTEHPGYGPATDGQPFRLERELGRQAVLIAARDELGLSTRDETLQEPFPIDRSAAPSEFELKVRIFTEGKMTLSLQRSADVTNSSAEPWTFDAHFTNNAHDAYISMLRVLEPLSRHELVTGLRALHLEGQKSADNPDNKPSADIEKLVDEMNLVSQFIAVRSAHTAIAREGQSVEWLGVLVRGYANLAMLTEHHWCSEYEGFSARALLYAERMVRLAGEKNTFALAHRTYARAVIGMHGAALDELKEISQLESEGAKGEGAPEWLEMIGPYCRFERTAFEELGRKHPQLSQLVARLSFEQYKYFGDDRWLYESGGRTLRVRPADYSIYAALATQSSALVVSRTGAYYGPSKLADTLS